MEVERMLVLLLHVMCVLCAAVGVAFADLAIFRGARVDHALLRPATRIVAGALALLWLSGLALVWIDTGFDPQEIARRPKLVAKLAVAALLTLNGVALHSGFFRALATRPRHVAAALARDTLLVALSGACWFYALFLGLARPLASRLALADYAGLFLLVCLGAFGFSALFIRPRLSRLYPAGPAPSRGEAGPAAVPGSHGHSGRQARNPT